MTIVNLYEDIMCPYCKEKNEVKEYFSLCDTEIECSICGEIFIGWSDYVLTFFSRKK